MKTGTREEEDNNEDDSDSDPDSSGSDESNDDEDKDEDEAEADDSNCDSDPGISVLEVDAIALPSTQQVRSTSRFSGFVVLPPTSQPMDHFQSKASSRLRGRILNFEARSRFAFYNLK